ncbi:peroxisome biogenesis factor 1 [Harmonia axyridis]|uniref:peroxisome biogenesis factor 1 n=1 Tax=Harmonia axyridis TaxID=115357 RepID=UPI001E27957C|nr:peroxisome biogenesis factor 1 [Harmonia axyridis]
MLDKILMVQYLNVKNNFCYLGYNLTKEIGSNAQIKVSYDQTREIFLSVGPQMQNVRENYIGINSLYAKFLKIEENSTVVLTHIGPVPRVNSFTIHPIRSDDFHVLDLLKNEVENCVLNQTSIVGNNQELLIWIGENLNIPVKVVYVDPSSPGKLDNLTELVILPQMKETEISKTKNNDENKLVPQFNGETTLKTLIVDILNTPSNLTDAEREIENKIRRYSNRKGNFKGRMVPWNSLDSYQIQICSHEFNVFLYKKSAPSLWKLSEEPIFCSLSIINNSDSREIYVRVFLIEQIPEESILINNIFVHENLLTILKCDLGTGVLLKPLKRNDICDEIEVYTKHEKKEVKNMLQNYLANRSEHYEFIVNADIPIILASNIICSLRFKPHYAKYCLIDQDFLRNCRYSFIDEHVQGLPNYEKIENIDFIETSNNNLCNNILESIANNLVQNMRLGCYLITGDIGTGKSKIVEKMKNSLCQCPNFIYSEVVQCKSLKGKTLDSLHKVFSTILENLIAHEPSILLIDDLHILCKSIPDSDAHLQNTVYYDRISEMLYLLFISVVENYSIGIVATAESKNMLNKNIYDSRGTYLFEKQYNIDELTQNDRMEIIKYFFKDYECVVDFEIFSQKTEGYVFQDLYDLIQRVIFQSLKTESNRIEEEHFEKALSQMVILSHSEIKLHTPGEKDFSNVGGMDDIKKLLGESLMWPLKYPNLFNSAPLRLQSGLLLYGPPGTGKTLLAGAAAKEYGVRLISIKGPELLSKYIGASEQAVRDVFVQAQGAKPCILFFDEFDSLAPRRGHDITGVTDRVVNQLLTQMDGIETLNGVFVLAATSRPDLLDPALLRPGRLDKQIYCPFPDKESRLDILRILSKNLKLLDDVDLEEIAETTEHFSGADLQSVLYNAQLSSMEDLLKSENNKDIEQLKPITREILKASLDKTRPSLTKKERQKYNLIYSKFQGKSNNDYLKPGTKASLA